MDNLTDYGENVAAITANLYQDKETYEEIYETIANDVGGFVGIWSICAESAKAFSVEEAPYIAGEDFYWIEAIEDYSAEIVESLRQGNILKMEKMKALAKSAILSNLVE